MPDSCVDFREGGYWVAGSRVSLDSIVYAFLQGDTAESIAQSFPAISLESVYGAIAYYLRGPAVLPVSLAADELLLVWGASDADEWTNRNCFLPV